MNIRASLGHHQGRRIEGVIALLLAALAVAGCDLRAPAHLQTLTAGRLNGESVSLPIDWPLDRAPFAVPARLELRFTAPKTNEPIGVFVTDTNMVFTARVNSRFVFQSGGPEAAVINPLSYRSTAFFRVPTELLNEGENTLEFALRLPKGSSYADFYPVFLGTAKEVQRTAFVTGLAFHAGPVLVGTILSVVGLVALGLWQGRKDSQLFLLLAFGAVLWSMQILLQQWPSPILPRPHNRVIINALFLWYPTLIAVFFLRFAYRSSSTMERIAALMAVVAAPLLYAGVAFGFFDEASVALRALVLLYVVIALVAVARYALQLKTLTGYTLLAMAAVCVGTGARDFFLDLASSGERVLILGPYSGAALVLFVGWLLLERYHKAFADFETMNRELEHRVVAANVELHRRLEEVETARASAEQANIAKSRFFAAASHDLRQPLHSLGLFASALRETVGPGEGRDLVRRIGDSIGALDRLFDELLDVSRLDAGTVEVRPRNFELQSLFDRLAEEYFAEAETRELRLRFHPTRLAVHADPLLLARVLANLVSNAIRYTRRGGVLVGARRCGEQVLLQVWDTGIGIPPDQRELIFDEFYQVGNPGRDRRRGLGLGLAIVRRLTRLMGQPLTLRSEPGRGSCFTLVLPPARGPVEPLTADEAASPARDFAGHRALVVDDDADICEATVRLLTRWGFEARAAHGDEAARGLLAAGFEPEVILADLRLGEAVDGIDVIEALRRQCRRPVAALLISGDTGARELARVKESGLLLLTKPVAPARLRSTLHALLLSPG